MTAAFVMLAKPGDPTWQSCCRSLCRSWAAYESPMAFRWLAQRETPCARSGAVLTKMDGDSRGGAALSVKAVSGKPIKFVGMGEKLEALEPFYPDRIASRILGAHPAGDPLWLVCLSVGFVESGSLCAPEA